MACFWGWLETKELSMKPSRGVPAALVEAPLGHLEGARHPGSGHWVLLGARAETFGDQVWKNV